MVRLWMLTMVVLVLFGAGACEKLYRPCESSTQCFEWGGADMRCVVSPYHGEAAGFCTLECSAWRPGLEAGDCVQDDVCGPDEAEGCCYINHTQGRAELAHGEGFCVPFPPPVPDPDTRVEPVEEPVVSAP